MSRARDRTSIPLITILIATLSACLAGPAATLAQEAEPTQREREEREARGVGERLSLELDLEGVLFENFFQAPSGRPQDNVLAGQLVGRLGYRVDPDRPLTVFGELGLTAYDEFDSSTILGAGVRYDGDRHALDAYLGRQTDQPILDVGDEFDRADVTLFNGEYGYRIAADWELKGAWDFARQSFDLTTRKDNDLFGIGPAVRYRGFGHVFSPEVGVLTGDRDAVDDNEDHDQTDYYVKVRSIPTPELYLSFRYRFRERDYTIADAAAGNFQRQDDRQQFTALAVLHPGERLEWHVYYSFQDADSTKATRIFTNQLLIAGLTLRF